MLRPGGWLLYSTCALDDRENQGVVERLVRKVGTDIEIDGPKGEGWEDRGFGSAVLPDRAAGAGPLYVARIRKSGAGSSGS
jgi:16S rRNA C967 or C1407 C5-methylase (RsmB/RsmF family)